MVQRRALNHEIDDEVRLFLQGQSHFQKEIELALSKADNLTRELVFFRAEGGDYRQAANHFSISDTQYYRRLQDFRLSLLLLIKK